MLLKLIKFGVVGSTGLIIDFGITYVLKEWLKWNKYIANAIGFTFAVVNNYYLNKIWTFQDTNPHIAQQLFSFIVISLIGLLLNTLVLYVFNHKIRMCFYFSKVFAIGAVFLWNFF